MQALDRSQPVLPSMPERRSRDYVRSGVTSLFAAFDIADDAVVSALHLRHRAVEFKKFLIAIDKTVPTELDVHNVCDNLATHKTVTVRDWLDKHPRFYIHFTPPGSSWINQVERWFGYLTDQLLRPGSAHLRRGTREGRAGMDRRLERKSETVCLDQTADEILNSLEKYIKRISGAEH
jgi:hypothetical protein